VDVSAPVLLQTARTFVCKVNNPKDTREVRVIFDCGSQRSYITDELKNYLMLDPVCTETMLIKTFGAENCSRQVCDVVELEVALQTEGSMRMSFLSVPSICEPISGQAVTYAIGSYKELESLKFSDYSQGDGDVEVDILVGLDQYWKLVTGEVVHCLNGPTAVYTRLGWVLSGPVQGSPSGTSSVNLITTHSLRVDAYQQQTESALEGQLKMFWDLESLGIRRDEPSVYDEFQRGIVYKHPRYEVSLPWRETHPALHDHYKLALRRLNGLLKRLKQNPEVLRQYDSVIREQLSKGIIESVQDSTPVTHPVHYLPHHAVVRDDKKTTKLRIVYDASAKANGPSLNDCLYTGPKFGQNIMDIIIRFRVHRVALTGDIEKAFLMISVTPQDRDVLRFLWVDDVLKNAPTVQTYRFTRVVFGVSSSPFLLNATIKHHIERYSETCPQFVQLFLRSVYVDDVSFGASDDDSAFELYVKSKAILREGGFNLRKFVTNSTLLQQRIDASEAESVVEHFNCSNTGVEEEDKTYTKNLLGGRLRQSEDEQKILGVVWNFVNDELVFDLSELAALIQDTEPTKRRIVAVATKFYDPIGFMAPVIICFKMLFQELCISGIAWDEPLSGDLLARWKWLVSGFQGVITSVPRCYFGLLGKEGNCCSLVGFCDASAGAYAAVVYLRIEGSAGTTVSFVVSKTRVSPISQQSIPRLELLSTLLLAKLINSVSIALEAEIQLQTHCYSDSKVALFWIKGTTKEWKPWVENRVNEIRKIVPADFWSHCPGTENPADIPSRGIAPAELASSKLWRYGPDWLINGNPVQEEEDSLDIPEECMKEIRSTHCNFTQASQTTLDLNAIIPCKNLSDLRRLLRVTGYVLMFVKLCRLRRASEVIETELSAVDVAEAETLWVKEMQKSLLDHKDFQNWKRQFDLFLEEGIWRCGGRISNANIPYSAKYPIVLMKSHHLAVLIAQDAHERVMHNKVKETLTEIRSRYWIIRGRQFVRQIIHKCVICRKLEGTPYALPPPPPLPDFRVTEQPPFMYTGVDFAGPLYVKTQGLVEMKKVWLSLFTCCVTRAVHLDIVPDLTAENFLRCFKRFTARRGVPLRMISDNGKTFKSAAKSISTMLRDSVVQGHSAGKGVQWSFNLEKAPWWGGLFERLIKSTKRCLKKTIGQARITYDELLTVVTEVEMILNSRPLTYVSTEDSEEPLTPSHLLMGRRILSLPDQSAACRDDDDWHGVTKELLNKQARHLSMTMQHFWKRWRGEYLLQLRECHRQGVKCKPQRLKQGEIVQLHNEKCIRGLWKLAKIERLLKGADGQVRGAVIRVASSKSSSKTLRRPLSCLYPLEIECTAPVDPVDAKSDDSPQNELKQSGDVNKESHSRPRRAAAQRTNQFLKTVVSQLNET